MTVRGKGRFSKLRISALSSCSPLPPDSKIPSPTSRLHRLKYALNSFLYCLHSLCASALLQCWLFFQFGALCLFHWQAQSEALKPYFRILVLLNQKDTIPRVTLRIRQVHISATNRSTHRPQLQRLI